ncbi:MAG: transcription initiation factor IIE alpha subunit [Bacillariaceae sp.]
MFSEHSGIGSSPTTKKATFTQHHTYIQQHQTNNINRISMSDLTVFAEALIATVARAFYDDEAICIIDVLIRDKFLRDDDMAPRLNMPAKKLRSTLQFLQDEHLVNSETVDDLSQGGSQSTKFWYVDYNRAVHTIRLRLHLLRKELEAAESRSRSSSFYLCPGHDLRRCNGRYTEEEAQQMIDINTGVFLCQECYLNYQNDPNGPKADTYTLRLVDNADDLRLAVDNIRRVNVQLSGKMIGSQQLRAGVYDLLQKVRGKGKAPITSNLPSENFALGRGSKRLAGTGRTAGIKARKLEQQGVAGTAESARNILVGGGVLGKPPGSGFQSDLTFLKNAMGDGLHFCIEKGGSARANLLSQRHSNPQRKKRKLLDAAATRVGTTVTLLEQNEVVERGKRQQQQQEELDRQERERQLQENGGNDSNGKDDDNKKKKKNDKNDNGGTDDNSNAKKPGMPGLTGMEWLNNNISRGGLDEEMEKLRKQDIEQEELLLAAAAEEEDEMLNDQSKIIVLSDYIDPAEQAPSLWDETTRKVTFQSLYKKEIGRQAKILQLPEHNETAGGNFSSPPKGLLFGGNIGDGDDRLIAWEDG